MPLGAKKRPARVSILLKAELPSLAGVLKIPREPFDLRCRHLATHLEISTEVPSNYLL